MSVRFDLLGDPVPENHGKRGANGHAPNGKTALKIRNLMVSGLNLQRIAQEIGLSVPTMRKHYFANGRIKVRHARDMALAEARATNLLQLQAAAEDGNVAAMGKVRQILEEEERRMADDGWARDAQAKAIGKAASAAPGKKELERMMAMQAETELDQLFDPDKLN